MHTYSLHIRLTPESPREATAFDHGQDFPTKRDAELVAFDYLRRYPERKQVIEIRETRTYKHIHYSQA